MAHLTGPDFQRIKSLCSSESLDFFKLRVKKKKRRSQAKCHLQEIRAKEQILFDFVFDSPKYLRFSLNSQIHSVSWTFHHPQAIPSSP